MKLTIGTLTTLALILLGPFAIAFAYGVLQRRHELRNG